MLDLLTATVKRLSPFSKLTHIIKYSKTLLVFQINGDEARAGVRVTSSAHKSEPVGSESSDPVRVMIATMDQLHAAIRTDPRFSAYQVSTPAEDVITLHRDGLKKVLLGPPLWRSFERRVDYLDHADGGMTSVVCVGDDQDFEDFPVEMRRPDIQQLGLPLSLGGLAAAVQSLHNLQTLVSHSNAEAREVDEANRNVKYVISISRELNGERDIPKLLTLILTKAREICNADAGSIYTVETPTENIRDGRIHFRFTQNDSIEQNLSAFSMPVNASSIVGNCVLHGTTINIPDLYKLSKNPEENPFKAKHDRSWDLRNGYESHSMITVPIFDISRNVIGVIQLINRKKKSSTKAKLITSEDFTDYVTPFDEEDQEHLEIIGQQAGMALENANFQESIEALFDGFVHASVYAIEKRDPTTSGHSHRVAHLTVRVAQIVSDIETGMYKGTRFTDGQVKELEYASLLHDFGKVGVREDVLVKAKKLYPRQLDRVLDRFDYIQAMLELECLRQTVAFKETPERFPPGFSPDSFEFERRKKVAELENYLDFILKANEPTVLEQGGFERLKDIAGLNFKNLRGEELPFLENEELKALSVSRGSLTREEFAEIQSHVTHTYDFLRTIPWGKSLSNVPQIAAKHHEKLDGSGYPTSAGAEEIPVQTRIMTIADIFDALTASDRPYKRAVPVERALDILQMEVKGGKLDGELFKIFTESKVYDEVLREGFRYRKRSIQAS